MLIRQVSVKRPFSHFPQARKRLGLAVELKQRLGYKQWFVINPYCMYKSLSFLPISAPYTFQRDQNPDCTCAIHVLYSGYAEHSAKCHMRLSQVNGNK